MMTVALALTKLIFNLISSKKDMGILLILTVEKPLLFLGFRSNWTDDSMFKNELILKL